MRLFQCSACGQTIHFENRSCMRCGSTLGFDPGDVAMHALVPLDDGLWQVHGGGSRTFRFCDNAVIDVCHWLVPADQPDRSSPSAHERGCHLLRREAALQRAAARERDDRALLRDDEHERVGLFGQSQRGAVPSS